jgi:predicted RNA binding protein YcfA (HicA-like mRNA interferase family)
MPLKPLRPREVARRLEKAGFKLTRQKGSHARYVKGPHGVTVPIHPGEVPLPVIRSILKQAGLTSEEWEKL